MLLRRRDDYQRVLAELGGQLFAVRGDVDRYFKPPETCNDHFETARGELLICALPVKHEGPHESGDWEWWDGGPEVLGCLLGIEKSKIPYHQMRTRLADRIAQHIRSGPEREQAALRLANSR
jgi:hypothetical protein